MKIMCRRITYYSIEKRQKILKRMNLTWFLSASFYLEILDAERSEKNVCWISSPTTFHCNALNLSTFLASGKHIWHSFWISSARTRGIFPTFSSHVHHPHFRNLLARCTLASQNTFLVDWTVWRFFLKMILHLKFGSRTSSATFPCF